jgi:recombinational DNA repair protein (RecF pathway)
MADFTYKLNRLNYIRTICSGAIDTKKVFLTMEPKPIAKLCKYCICDICDELLLDINFATFEHKSYNRIDTNKIKNIDLEHYNTLIPELKNQIERTNAEYLQKYSLWKLLKSSKIMDKKHCIVCLNV